MLNFLWNTTKFFGMIALTLLCINFIFINIAITNLIINMPYYLDILREVLYQSP